MIITQTPYRVSFAGGGTDLPSFYQKEIGAVFSVAINKHMYVTLSHRFEQSTRVAYSKTEICDSIDQIQHTIVREALRYLDLGPHLEITTIGDVPAGTGMGSSSTLALRLESGCASANCRAMTPIATCACASVTPGFNRPMASIK